MKTNRTQGRKALSMFFAMLTPLLISAQQFQTGDTFNYVNTDGVEKTYKIVGENLIENPSFDNGTEGWTGGAGGSLTGIDWHSNGGVDDGAYLRLKENAGKGGNGSIGTSWNIETEKTYVFSWFMRNYTNADAENPANAGYINAWLSNSFLSQEFVLQPLPIVDANLAWTQNTYVFTNTEGYKAIDFSARWLAGAKCFDAFILAEVEELPNPDGLSKLLAECDDYLAINDFLDGRDMLQSYVSKGRDMLNAFAKYSVGEINNMIEELKEALFAYRWTNASEEYPLDITALYLKNTKFDNWLNDWTTTNGRIHKGINVRHFTYFEEMINPICEISGQPNDTSSIFQTIYNLPMGYYRLSVQCVMNHELTGNSYDMKSGAIIFFNDEELDMITQHSTKEAAIHENSYPETFSIKIHVRSPYSTVGFKGLPSAKFSYVAIDNFKLECLGTDQYTITYLVDGEAYKTDTVVSGLNIPLIDVPRKEGHSFMGWKNVPIVMPERSIVIEGGFNYQVTFKIDDEVIKSDSIEYGERIPLPDVVEKEGYTFNGWNAPETMPAEDIVLTGTYSINSYSLKYIVDGEVYHQSTVAYGGTITPPMELPVKEGHTFVGWSNLPSTMPASDVEVEAIFTTNKYCITYVIDNTVIAMDSISYGDDIILMDPPTREGFTFAGWSYVPEKMPATDIMVIGVYTTNSYLLTYLVDGEVYESGIVECGSAITPPEIPSKEGYTFSGWNNIPEVMPANELVITGTFVANKYLVTFMIDDQIIASDSLDYGTMITVPNVPEREGYSFSGWGEVAETVPANDVTYEGHYSVNSYKLTYTVDGEIVLEESVAYGTALTLLAEPTKEGYTFSGWSEVPETMPAEDVVVSGTFTINEYLVTFTVDGVAIASDSLAYGTAIIIPTMPEREGYTFSGWSEVDATVPAHDVTYDASYTANIYKVYYFVGATLVHTAEVAYGEAIPEYIYEPTAEGDVFMGWIGETYETMPAHDVTYTANITNDVLQLTNDNSQLTIYDLSGRKIEIDDLRELCEGIYIINGQKVVINNK